MGNDDLGKRNLPPGASPSDGFNPAGPPSSAKPTSTILNVAHNAAAVLILYLSIHAAFLFILAVYPFVSTLTIDERPGLFYLNIITLQVQNMQAYFIGPLMAVISAAALWLPEMRIKRNLLLYISGFGMASSFLFYLGLSALEYGQTLWEAPGPPKKLEFKEMVASFAWANGALFIGSMLGVFGGRAIRTTVQRAKDRRTQ